MNDYQELLNEFNRLRENTSSFIKAAFHVHSPESHDWPKGGDEQLNDKEKFLEDENLFLDELAKHFDLVCITDHMKTSYACKLAQDSLVRDDITVFPGMEVNCIVGVGLNRRIHILVIFPPDSTVAQIERIFANNPIPDEEDRNGQEDYHLNDQDLKGWADIIERNGGIMILAHVDETSRGHRAHFRAMRKNTLKMFVKDDEGTTIDDEREISEEYKSIVFKSNAHAIEVLKPEDHEHYINFELADDKTGRIPCVLRSDFHTIEDLKQEDKSTHIKVSKLEFEYVKEALKFFETRIKYGNEIPENPPNKILGVRILSPSGSGLFREANIGFSNNLNCLIGPRGSGKSTIIEALRYVFGQNNKLIRSPEDNRSIDFSDLALKIQSSNLQDSLIEVLYQRDGNEISCLRATFDSEEEFNTDVFSLDGNKVEISKDGVEDKFPIRIFSWSEIENLGRQPALQRNLIDRQIPEMPSKKNELLQLYSDLEESTSNIISESNKLELKSKENNSELIRYNEYKSEFDRLNTQELSALFESLDDLRAKKDLLTDAIEKLSDFRDLLTEMDDFNYQEYQEDTFQDEYRDLKEWWTINIDDKIEFIELEEFVEENINKSVDRLNSKIQLLNTEQEKIQDNIKESEESIRSQIDSESDEEIKATKRENAKKRYESAKSLKDEYEEIFENIEGLLEARSEICKEILDLKSEVTSSRENSQIEMNEELNILRIHGDIISVEFTKGSDKEELIEYMKDTEFLMSEQFGHYKEKRIAEKFSLLSDPIRLGESLLDQDLDSLREARDNLVEDDEIEENNIIDVDSCEKLINHFNPFSFNENFDSQEIDSSKLEKVLWLQQIKWDDEIKILLDETPVDELSPGQRSSAMLPLIALSEKSPLIIDQPEDNLDNRMVGKTLNKVLADLKEKRQIIVATHNPNIVVGGDAEQVIVLEAVSKDEAKVDNIGSIDEDQIINSVIDLMEGGKEAFLIRKRRYKKFLN